MDFIADLHIHSAYSRATSKASNLAGLYAWARAKGINLVGTGDFTHPGWFKQLKNCLVPAEPGFFKLKEENVPPALPHIAPEEIPVRFTLTAEISSIYKRHGQVRKVHNILFVPDFRSAEKMNRRLAGIGNIESDGRPILGLDSRDLLEILLEEAPDGFLVPAHIWTPWFSLFGSKSGFDSIEECFGDLTRHIFALETGLSSDPDMNRLISALDRYTLISNSDCHSPSKLGREVNLFSTDFDFYSMTEALKVPGKGFKGTVEFFPEEGKYHMDGHRKCNVSLNPRQTRELKGICPVCGKPLTVGVCHRVMELADRDTPLYPENAPGYKSLIPLQEILSEILDRGPNTKGVLNEYQKVINAFGSEFGLLLHTPVEDMQKSFPLLAEAVKRIRKNQVIRQAGFDGQFGIIHVFEPGETASLSGQTSLFGGSEAKKKELPQKADAIEPLPLLKLLEKGPGTFSESNPEQRQAIESTAARILITAGPGTGKTFTLVSRLSRLLREKKIPGEHITAITFTNRAADEMRERLSRLLNHLADKVFIGTFHSFCLHWLRREQPELTVVGDEERNVLLRKIFPAASATERKQTAKALAAFFLSGDRGSHVQGLLPAIHSYQSELRRRNAVDLEEIIPFFVEKLAADTSFEQKIRREVKYLFVDEFQDVNGPQYELISRLAGSAQIFGIGDPDQAIYGFRGSNLNYFFRFGGAESTRNLTLSRNYRSSSTIIEAASHVIKHNRLKSNIRLVPHREEKGVIRLFRAPTPQAEAEYIVKEIEKSLGGVSSFSLHSGRSDGEKTAYSFQDIAVCYRTGRQAAPIAEALKRRGLPFQLVGGTPFFMETDIRPLYFWIIIAAGEASLGDFIHLCSETPGIGGATCTFLENSLDLGSGTFFHQALKMEVPARSRSVLAELYRNLTAFQENAAGNLGRSILESFRLFNLDPGSANGRRLLELTEAFGSLDALASHLKENSRATIYDDRAEAVGLMTLHGAKGLEFPVVFITGCNEGLLPHLTGSADIEEERRLFYVGMTRARDQLYLSCIQGKPVSRFINEIPEELVAEIEMEKPKKRKAKARQLTLF